MGVETELEVKTWSKKFDQEMEPKIHCLSIHISNHRHLSSDVGTHAKKYICKKVDLLWG